jgi:quinoprotein glucose dehydrogenase
MGASLRRWLLQIIAVFISLVGAVLTVGGAYLIVLGGTAYYFITGMACVLSGILIWRADRYGPQVYAAMLAGTTIWALWEVGGSFWQLLPRLAGPVVIGLLLALALGPLRQGPRGTANKSGRRSVGLATAWAALALAITFVTTPVFDVAPSAARVSSLAHSRSFSQAPVDAKWSAYGGDNSGTRHSPASVITPENVTMLRPAWTFETGDTAAKRPEIKAPISFMATPVIVDDRVIFCSPTGKVFALDADSGQQLWLRDPHTRTGNAQMLNCRGVSVHRDTAAMGLCAGRIISTTVDGRMLASDAETGAPCPDFGTDGSINLDTGMGAIDPLRSYSSSPPAIVGNTAILGAYVRDNFTHDDPSGVVRAFDVKTGRLLWAWDSGKSDDAALSGIDDQWTRGSPNAWSVFSADPALGLVYLPTGNATPDHVGTHRSALLERYASSIVALDVATGKVRWHFQTVHHDLWDYDMPAQPVLFDFSVNGRMVPALAAPTKRGEVFILDRRTGRPLTGVEERSVPQGRLPGEHYSPTQPFVNGFASFAPPPLTEAAMWGVTPLDQLWCRIRFRSLDYAGMFTPPSERGSIQYPGTFGMLNWGSVSIDPMRQLMIVNAAAIPQEVRLFRHARQNDRPAMAKDSHAPGYLPQIGTQYGVSLFPMLSPLGIPCHAPPWGRISAVDLRSGKIAWSRSLGTTADTAPFHIAIPGAFNLGGTVNTASGLSFIGATLDNYLRAFDTKTGRELWRGRLPAGGQATPMTYVSRKSGRQFVVIAAGGHMYMRTTPGDHVVAFALPIP